MTALEDRVSAHYDTGDLLGRIKQALIAAGVDPDNPLPADLKQVDEFHTGGLEATRALLTQILISADTRVLDIGCGLGGTARYIADQFDADVTGIDLTPLFVETARALTLMVGLAARFELGSALDLPVDDGQYDLATMFHVGMNIHDKDALMTEVTRVLRPGGTFALFDVMQTSAGDVTFPVPWAEEPSFSHVAPAGAYRMAAASAGLIAVGERDRRDFALDFFRNSAAAAKANGGPPPLGLHLLMRHTAAEKLKNYAKAIEGGILAPVEMIFRKPD